MSKSEVNLKLYLVEVNDSKLTTYRIEAQNEEEAKELVYSGQPTTQSITVTSEIVGCVLERAKTDDLVSKTIAHI